MRGRLHLRFYQGPCLFLLLLNLQLALLRQGKDIRNRLQMLLLAWLLGGIKWLLLKHWRLQAWLEWRYGWLLAWPE